MRKIILLAIVTLVTICHGAGGTGALDFCIGVPKGEFAQNLDRNGFGISANLGYAPVPFINFGLAFGFLGYGHESRYEPFSMTIPDVVVQVTTSNNFTFWHGYLQLRADIPYVKPYAEVRGGFNYLWTETRIEDLDDYYDDVASSTNFDDFAFSYGIGGGLYIQVWEDPALRRGQRGRRRGSEDLPDRVYIDLKVMYVPGGEAAYLKEGDIERYSTYVVYNYSQSETDLLTINFGVGVDF